MKNQCVYFLKCHISPLKETLMLQHWMIFKKNGELLIFLATSFFPVSTWKHSIAQSRTPTEHTAVFSIHPTPLGYVATLTAGRASLPGVTSLLDNPLVRVPESSLKPEEWSCTRSRCLFLEWTYWCNVKMSTYWWSCCCTNSSFYFFLPW